MFVLDEACVGNLSFTIIHHGIALKIVCVVQTFVLESQASVFQMPVLVVEILVNAPCVECFTCYTGQLAFMFKEIAVRSDFRMFQQFFSQSVVASYRNALIRVVKVIVVIGIAERDTLDDESGQFGGGPSPLLFGITFDKTLIDVLAT